VGSWALEEELREDGGKEMSEAIKEVKKVKRSKREVRHGELIEALKSICDELCLIRTVLEGGKEKKDE